MHISSWIKMTLSHGNIFRVTGPLWVNPPVIGGFLSQRPVTRSFNIFFDLHPNKRLSKQSRRWWFEAQSRSLWRHCNIQGEQEGWECDNSNPKWGNDIWIWQWPRIDSEICLTWGRKNIGTSSKLVIGVIYWIPDWSVESFQYDRMND